MAENENRALRVVDSETEFPQADTSSASLILTGDGMRRIMDFAEVMASSKATIPAHLRGNKGDCAAITMQAMRWGMDPYAVAAKTHLSQSGALGYEGQLVNAVIISNAPIKGRPKYEYLGDWSKVLGKVEERKSDKGGKYYVATYTKKDEEGLGIIYRATFIGDDEPSEVTVMMSQAYPRFSTQWATDPKQQIAYLAGRKWARLHAPDVIMGVYTPEELDETPPQRNMGAAEIVQPQPSADLHKAAHTAAKKGVAEYQKFWSTASKDDRKLLAKDHEGFKQTAIDVDKSRTVDNDAATTATTATEHSAPTEPAAATDPAAPTYAEVLDKIINAAHLESLYIAADLIGSVQDEAQRAELQAKYEALRDKFEEQQQ